jgi:hypothetical protein
MQKLSALKGALGVASLWVCLATALLQGLVLSAGMNPPPAFKIVAFGVQDGGFNVRISSATGGVYALQASDDIQGYWTEIAHQPGNGGTLSFLDPTESPARFFRVAGLPRATLALFPSVPLLSSGAVSLPDATVGSDYSIDLSPGSTGTAPYNLQLSNAPLGGLSASVISNNTGNALVRLNSTGTNLIGDQRSQFTVTVGDAAGTTLSRLYDIRVVAPAPEILTSQIVLKAGATTNLTLASTNGTRPLVWSLVSGRVPAGVSFFPNRSFGGTPTADAAESNETGLYTNVIQVADSYTDRVTGQPKNRTTSQTVAQRIRLSYRLNILPDRPGGPFLHGVCLECHGPGFPPDFSASSASAVIYANAGSGGDCSPSLYYIVPGDLTDSLIYLKLTNPICGNRMPDGGPYLDTRRINRLARWILELTFSDSD